MRLVEGVPPQVQRGPSSEIGTCPSSRAVSSGPVSRCPPLSAAAPKPVLIVRYIRSSMPPPAPKARSPRIATFVSCSRKTGSPSAAPIGPARSVPGKRGPRFAGSTATPVHGFNGPGALMPMPTRRDTAAASSLVAFSRARCSVAMQAATTAEGPSETGVGAAARPRRVPSARTNAARTCVPPRSSASTVASAGGCVTSNSVHSPSCAGETLLWITCA